MFPMGPTLKQEFQQIKQFTRITQYDKPPLFYKDKKLILSKLFWADSTFLDLFNFTLLEGNRQTALQSPNSMVLTKESAQKLFGNEDPMGKLVAIKSNDTTTYTVTGILANVPGNSHLQFDGLLSFNTRNTAQLMGNWG
ncbi:ABC transporter permease [Paraflavitalea speifideaquila]|uniref:ABC transporter permease n=1 Tax=Paraflavitalea speifideaquila TaxID=3076558 RepID=UPI0028E30ECF|nr:ABC transporter permease [Paraflavitalea speifideiaquila]